MHRLTQKDDQGNWCLEGLSWEDMHEGKTITREVREKLYGALWKLMEYEDTGLSPDRVEELDGLYLEKCEEVYALRKQHRWIPVTEQLPKWYTPVLVSTSAGVDINVIAEGRWFLDEEGYEITAWMPLPEPYREE